MIGKSLRYRFLSKFVYFVYVEMGGAHATVCHVEVKGQFVRVDSLY